MSGAERSYCAEAEQIATDPEEQVYRKAMRERRNGQARQRAAEEQTRVAEAIDTVFEEDAELFARLANT